MWYLICIWAFAIGFSLGAYCNSDKGAAHGLAAGKATRGFLIKHNALPKAWEKVEK